MLRFIADGELGALARRLRMLGFDCRYDGAASLASNIALAAQEERMLLTRKPVAETLKLKVFRPTSSDPNEQLAELAALYPLSGETDPFSRCLVCNVPLEELCSSTESLKDDERQLVPPAIVERGLPLQRCPCCRRIYWPGSHLKRMKGHLARAGFDLD